MSNEAAAGDHVSASGSNAEEEQSGDRFVPHFLSKLYEPARPCNEPPDFFGKGQMEQTAARYAVRVSRSVL